MIDETRCWTWPDEAGEWHEGARLRSGAGRYALGAVLLATALGAAGSPVGRRPSQRVRLARVRVVSDTKNQGDDLKIVLVCGDRVRIPAGTSIDTFRRVVQVLRGGC